MYSLIEKVRLSFNSTCLWCLAAKVVTNGKGGLHVSPPCGRVSGTNSFIEKVRISFHLWSHCGER
jgi:hypothetical protein